MKYLFNTIVIAVLPFAATLGSHEPTPAPRPSMTYPQALDAVGILGERALQTMRFVSADWSKLALADHPSPSDGEPELPADFGDVPKPKSRVVPPKAKTPMPPPQAPPATGPSLDIKIDPESGVEVGDAVHVLLSVNGARMIKSEDGGPGEPDVEILIMPVPTPKNFFRDPNSALNFAFVGKKGIYTIRATMVREDRGAITKEARVEIRGEPQHGVAAKAKPNSDDPETLIIQWIEDVPFTNADAKMAERKQMAASARSTAEGINTRRLDGTRAVDEWGTAAYLKMGQAFLPWNQVGSGVAFLAHAKQMFADNARLRDGLPPDKLLLFFADILDGK